MIAFPPLKRWAVIYGPSRDGRFYPNTLCLSTVTPDFRNSAMNLLERPLLMMLGLLRDVMGDVILMSPAYEGSMAELEAAAISRHLKPYRHRRNHKTQHFRVAAFRISSTQRGEHRVLSRLSWGR